MNYGDDYMQSMNTPIPTPRTEAFLAQGRGLDDPSAKMVEFARQLERELSACRQECEGLREQFLSVCRAHQDSILKAESAEARLTELQQQHDWACKSEGICPSCDNPYFVSVSWEKDPNCDNVEVPVKHCGNCGESFCDHSAMLICDAHRAHKKELTSLQAAYAGAVEALRKIHHRVASWGEPFRSNPHTPGHRELMGICDKALSSTPQSVKDVMDVLEAVKAYDSAISALEKEHGRKDLELTQHSKLVPIRELARKL